MDERRRLFWLILIMTAVSLVVLGITITLLYRTVLDEERDRLVETAQSQARLIEAVARFDILHKKDDYPGGPAAATLSQIIDAHQHYKGCSETGEFTLAKRDENQITFLLRHRHGDLDKPRPVDFDSRLAEPMRLALSGLSGTVIGLDYRGEVVLAAYEPVAVLNLGIVAKVDLAEIRAPFVKAGLIAFCAALLVILVGALLFLRVTNPIIRRLKVRTDNLTTAIERLRYEIDKRIHAEEALQEAHDELEQRVKDRTAALVEANDKLIGSQEELRRLSSQLLTAQEDERARIARELHDGIGQTMSAIKFMIEGAIEQMETETVVSSGKSLAKLVPLIQDSVNEIRRITMDLRPTLLDDLGILETIAWFCREFRKVYSHIHIKKKIWVKEHEVPDALKIVIFRIMQEAMNNVAKHSQAEKVTLCLTKMYDHIELNIEDNGHGFDPDNVQVAESSGRGYGLGSMKERTELTGGTLTIDSVQDKRTIIRATWAVGEQNRLVETMS